MDLGSTSFHSKLTILSSLFEEADILLHDRIEDDILNCEILFSRYNKYNGSVDFSDNFLDTSSCIKIKRKDNLI